MNLSILKSIWHEIQYPYSRNTKLFPFIAKNVKKGKSTKGTGGTNSARYCYSVWMRHFINLNETGEYNTVKTIAEIGPGDSLGIGLTALLTGSEKYFAFDIIEHANTAQNIKILDELTLLFKNRTDIPGDDEFPMVEPKLKNYSFPSDYLNSQQIEYLLDKAKITNIKNAIINGQSEEFTVKYIVPWYNYQSETISIDLIFSQAVLEHIDAIEHAYKTMYSWLVKDGIISHSIDYSAHETHKLWNGHWAYSKVTWSIILYGRSYSINRLPHSEHIRLITESGFRVFNIKNTIDENGISLSRYQFRINDLQDMVIKNAFVQAKKV